MNERHISRLLSVFTAILLPIISLTQPLQLSHTKLDFGEVNELQTDSLMISLSNPFPFPVQVTEIRFYARYKKPAFFTNDQSFSIAPGDTHMLWVYFAPEHNVFHNSEMLILTDSHRGSLAIDLKGQGIYSNPYYDLTKNKSEQNLKDALKTRLAIGYSQFSYNTARDRIFLNIDNKKVNGQGATVNTLEGIYTGREITGYNNRSEAQAMGFNTEHVWPQSLFNQDLPMRTDMFHLFPADVGANGSRSNLPFGTVSQAQTDWEDGGSRRGNGKFEPRDEAKGRIARAMLYFVLRYQNYQSFMNGQEVILRQWHEDFPPDAVSRKRNEDIFGYQNNRNPFIDYPQFLDRISSMSAPSAAAVDWGIDLSESVMDMDTVPKQTDILYHYLIINTGNQDLNLTKFSLSDSRLRFGRGTGQDTVLKVGEAHVVEILLYAPESGNVDADLQFETNSPDHSQVVYTHSGTDFINNFSGPERLRSFWPGNISATC